MKLLFDQNLAPSLVRRLADLFPESAHLEQAGLGELPDHEIWIYARNQGFTIVTKDSDFHELATLRGSPPKVIWLKLGNCSVAEVAGVLRRDHALIEAFDQSDNSVLLIV